MSSIVLQRAYDCTAGFGLDLMFVTADTWARRAEGLMGSTRRAEKAYPFGTRLVWKLRKGHGDNESSELELGSCHRFIDEALRREGLTRQYLSVPTGLASEGQEYELSSKEDVIYLPFIIIDNSVLDPSATCANYIPRFLRPLSTPTPSASVSLPKQMAWSIASQLDLSLISA